MQTALVDTTALYAAANRNAERHDRALSIVQAADAGDFPRLRVPDPILIETMNGLARDVSHETATDLLKRLETGVQFEPVREPRAVWERGTAAFRSVRRLSLADGLLVASSRHHDITYLYSFDDDFDGIDGVTRLATAENPYSAQVRTAFTPPPRSLRDRSRHSVSCRAR